jgi:hypothetical protein
MKTKIIYISGSEVFNMGDVRMAFDTVRHELGLGNDTILFGVPVDKEDALGGQFESVQANTVSATPLAEVENDKHDTDIATPDVEEDNSTIDIKPKRTRKKAAPVKEIVQEVPETEQDEIVAPVETDSKKEVIPILSVLSNDEQPNDTADDIKVDIEIPDNIITDDDVISVQDMNTDFQESEIDNTENITSHNVSFDAADIDDEIPTVNTESTSIQNTDDDDNQLEKLLQSVQSLNEDKEITPDLTVSAPDDNLDETDATLEMLANEFAENQDKIINTTKSTARGGRIGKLKNILPFKKAKHSDSGLMGDLFGWAGVAANDDEFSIPEFFPTAAKK